MRGCVTLWIAAHSYGRCSGGANAIWWDLLMAGACSATRYKADLMHMRLLELKSSRKEQPADREVDRAEQF